MFYEGHLFSHKIKGQSILNFELIFSHATLDNSSFPFKFSFPICIERRKNMISECYHIVSSNLSHHTIHSGKINIDFNRCNNQGTVITFCLIKQENI